MLEKKLKPFNFTVMKRNFFSFPFLFSYSIFDDDKKKIFFTRETRFEWWEFTCGRKARSPLKKHTRNCFLFGLIAICFLFFMLTFFFERQNLIELLVVLVVWQRHWEKFRKGYKPLASFWYSETLCMTPISTIKQAQLTHKIIRTIRPQIKYFTVRIKKKIIPN